ncbi:MAG: hypothetical protein E7398_02630 [Ruminococcaceae bacterium]|nr:hypothetical protein [Oscillospiraceae bacterium]
MLRKRKTIAAILALVLSALMLTSCIGANTNGSKGATLEITVWNTQGTGYVYQELEEDIPTQWLTDKTGVYVQNIYGNDGGQWDSKLTKLYTGDNLPDVVWCQSGQGPAHYNKLLSLEALTLLDEEMIKTYAPNIWKRTPSYMWDYFRTEDGKITGIPFRFDNGEIESVLYDHDAEELKRLVDLKGSLPSSIQTSLYIRDDILKEIFPECKTYDEIMALMKEKQAPVGDEIMDIPIHTSQELIDFMYKIKDLNKTVDGRKVYAYGYAGDGSDNWEALVYLGNTMYGTNWHQYTAHWNTATEEIEIPLMGDLVKQMAKTQNQMILDRVIDPESLAHTTAQFQAKVYQGVYAICCATRADALKNVNKQLEETGATFKYRPFWIDIPNPEGYDPFTVKYPFGESFCFTNTLSEEEVIQVLKWADIQFTDEFMEIAIWGPEEADLYTVNEDGIRVYRDESYTNSWVFSSGPSVDVAKTKGLNNKGGKFRVLPTNVNPYSPDFMAGATVKLTPQASTGFKFSPDSKYITSVVDAPPSYAYSAEFGEIEELVNYWARREEYEIAIKKAIAAEEGAFDKKWDEVLAIVNKICDVEKMEKEMTEIALPYYETIKSAMK